MKMLIHSLKFIFLLCLVLASLPSNTIVVIGKNETKSNYYVVFIILIDVKISCERVDSRHFTTFRSQTIRIIEGIN